MKKIMILMLLASHCSFASDLYSFDPHQHPDTPRAGNDAVDNAIVVQSIDIAPAESGGIAAGDYVVTVATGEGINSPNQDCIFIYNKKTKQTTKLHHQYMPWRPISDVAWKDESHVVFDVYANPHFAHHYVFNVVLNKVVSSVSFNEPASE